MAKKKRSNTSTTSATTPQRICDYILYTDGGCSNNPGGVGGIGVVAIDTETGECIEESRGYASTTNNRMEIRAALVALQMVPDGCSVLLHSDSQYLLNTIAGVWQKKKNRDLWKMLDAEVNYSPPSRCTRLEEGASIRRSLVSRLRGVKFTGRFLTVQTLQTILCSELTPAFQPVLCKLILYSQYILSECCI